MLPTLYIIDDDSEQDMLERDYIVTIFQNKIVIPARFRTDYASIPALFLPLLKRSENGYKKPAVIHDYLYSTQIYSKAIADNIFKEAMKINGVNLITRTVMYNAVKLFGYYAWDKCTLIKKKDEMIKKKDEMITINTILYFKNEN